MDAPATLTGSKAVIEDAVGALEALAGLVHQAHGPDLAGLVTLCDTVAVVAAQARTAAVAEAVRRDEMTGTVPGWIRAHAPSLRQGGAHQLARWVTDATRRPALGPGGEAGADPDTSTGIVWAAAAASPVDPDQGVRPVLAAGSALAVLAEMRALQPRLQPDAVPTVTRALLDLVVEWGPTHMRALRPRLLATHGVDGELDDLHDTLAQTAHLSTPQVESGALTEYRMALTPEQAATLEAAIGPLAAPAPNRDTGERDLRPAGQRRIEALTEVCRAAIATHHATRTDGPAGAYAALHVTMTLADLRHLTGASPALPGSSYSRQHGHHGHRVLTGPLSGDVLASSATGTLLCPATLRRIACAADLIPQVLGSTGEILDQGRETRLATRAQRRALLRRDRHCTYPGCDRPAAWTRAHHIRHWWDGGDTSLDNLALLCERHHATVHTRRLWATLEPGPDASGPHVLWDLTPGSYDTALRRDLALRALHDPPAVSPTHVASLRAALLSADRHDHGWASDQLAWLDPDPPPITDPLIWDDVTQTFVA